MTRIAPDMTAVFTAGIRFTETDGRVETDNYTTRDRAEANLRHYGESYAGAEVVDIVPVCRHGRVAGECTAAHYTHPAFSRWDVPRVVAVCVHHRDATA